MIIIAPFPSFGKAQQTTFEPTALIGQDHNISCPLWPSKHELCSQPSVSGPDEAW